MSVEICGSSESDTRTIDWLANEATARSVMAEVALPEAVEEVAKLTPAGPAGFLPRERFQAKPMTIDKTYQPSEVEGRIYRTWEEAGALRAGRPARGGAEPYSIVIPPPHVTRSLHMGHAPHNTPGTFVA